MSTPVAIMGSGTIGTALMIKVKRLSSELEVVAMVGIDAASDRLARARRLGVATSHEGVDGLVEPPEFAGVRPAFDATSAAAHHHSHEVLREHATPSGTWPPRRSGRTWCRR